MAEDFTQPRWPQSHSGPSGSTMMCPISPAFPEVPRTTSSLRTIPQPIPVPMYMKTKLPAPLGPPAQVSATAALVTSLSSSVDSPVASARASRSGTRSQPGSSGGSTTAPSSRSIGPGEATPSPATLAAVHAGVLRSAA